METLNVLVGDVLCTALSPTGRDVQGIGASLSDFAVRDPPSDPDIPSVTICSRHHGLPDRLPRPESLVFDSEVYCRIYLEDGQYILLMSTHGGTRHYCTAIFSQDFREGVVHFLPPASGAPYPHALTHPIHQFAVNSMLSQGYGVSLHACGVADEGRGFLFPGHSGAGKSTMGRQWSRHAVVLNDERIVLRKRHGRLWIYGTPWFGENGRCVNAAVPLHQIFFLDQATQNRVSPVGGVEASTRLLSHAMLPYWSRAGMQFVTDFAARVAESIPCHRLGFVPDESVVPFIRCVS